MKRGLMNPISCLLAISLLIGMIPCQAMAPTPPRQVASMEELLGWYGGLSGNALQECIVTEPIVSTGEVILGTTPCRVDVTFLGGLRVPAGARLTIDNPNLVLMGPPPAITVEPGGVLHIRRWNMLTAQAMPQGGIVVQAGGTLLMEAGTTLPDGVVIDQNPPSNGLPPPTTTPPAPETPDETPPAEEKLTIKGEVLKVTVGGMLLAMVTLPRVDPTLTETIAIARSADAQAWNTEYVFRWDKEMLGFKSDQDTEFGNLTGRTRNDGSKTDFKYLARLSGKPFFLRVTLTATDGRQTVSNAIQLTEPPVGQYPGSDNYDDSEGNRGGGGQGTTDREEQQEAAISHTDSTVTAKPKIAPRSTNGAAIVEAPSGSATVTQETQLTAQGTAAQQAAAGAEAAGLPAQASPPAQGEPTGAEPNKPLDSSARNWLVIAATLALCGAIWIFTTKRKKS